MSAAGKLAALRFLCEKRHGGDEQQLVSVGLTVVSK
jgi:hypothetical protein